MLHGAESRGELEGVRVCRGAPVISHLFFADDSLILMHADRRNATNLKNVLDTYYAVSGQKLSHDKSSIFFQHEHDGGSKGGGVPNFKCHDRIS